MNSSTHMCFERSCSPDTGLPQEVLKKVTVEGKSLLKAWREYKNLTQQEVAERMGITPAVIGVLEKSNNRVSSASIQRLAVALDVTIEQLTL